MSRRRFIKMLAAYQSPKVFNPYAQRCEQADRYNAVQIRKRNLAQLLDAGLEQGIDSLWLGRDLGFRGGRRTGLALTDEARLPNASKMWQIELKQATKGAPVAERTAGAIWRFVEQADANIFMWNIFPFHPHEPDNAMTNRAHTAKERDQGLAILSTLIAMLKPKTIAALGNDAYLGAQKVATTESVYKLRHPSYGGERIFAKQIADLYGLEG